MRGRDGVVEGGEDTGGTLLLNKLADDLELHAVSLREKAGGSGRPARSHLVVKVVDRRPFDLLADVLLLLGFEGELNEDLLDWRAQRRHVRGEILSKRVASDSRFSLT